MKNLLLRTPFWLATLVTYLCALVLIGQEKDTNPAANPEVTSQSEQSTPTLAPKRRATLKGHTDAVVAVAFSPDSKTLASASYDGTLKLWDTTTGSE